ncbi:MAG: trypsin-like peptidase domain-containing protein [bacterium]
MKGPVIRGFILGLLIGGAAMGLIRFGAWLERENGSNRDSVDTVQQIMPDRPLATPSAPLPTSDSARAVSRTETLDQISNNRHTAITEVIRKVEPAVVGITVTQVREYRAVNPMFNDPFFRNFFNIPQQTYKQKVENLGSGFVISPDGYVVTNEHVVHMASKIVVTFENGKSMNAEVIGTDYDTDIALVKVDGKDLPFLKISPTDNILVGEWVIAIGNPFGLFKVNDQASVSVGVVSAMGRNFERQEDGRLYRNMIQTDAAINPGNSGGPLVNVLGEVMGVNTFIFTGGSGGSVGVGFALPASVLRDVVNELRERGSVDRDFWTGLYVQNIDKLIASSVGYSGNGGVIVTEVDKNSPGARAGIEAADIITGIEGAPISDAQGIRKYFDNHDLRVGDRLKMKIFRKNDTLTVTLQLEARPK